MDVWIAPSICVVVTNVSQCVGFNSRCKDWLAQLVLLSLTTRKQSVIVTVDDCWCRVSGADRSSGPTCSSRWWVLNGTDVWNRWQGDDITEGRYTWACRIIWWGKLLGRTCNPTEMSRSSSISWLVHSLLMIMYRKTSWWDSLGESGAVCYGHQIAHRQNIKHAPFVDHHHNYLIRQHKLTYHNKTKQRVPE